MFSNPDSLIAHIENCYQKVEDGVTKLPQQAFDMEGMTGRKTRMFYNLLCEGAEPINYLEIGVWKGSSTAASLYGNPNVTSFLCDDWSEFMGSFKEFCDAAGFAINWEKTEILEGDFKLLDFSTLPPIHIYLYDGPHGLKDHKHAITLLKNTFAKYCILLVDDWNWIDVRNGTALGFEKSPELKVLYKKEIFSTTYTEKPGDDQGYWNGMGIFLIEKV